MTKISETGHAKNVENFRRLYDHLMNFGGKYAPSDARLQLANVATVLQAASSSLTALSVANPPFLQAVSRREAAFACSQMGEAATRQVKMDKAHFTARRTFAARSAFTCSQMGEAAARQVKWGERESGFL
jgi:hypothetical protein